MTKVKYISPIDPHVHLRGDEYATNYAKYGIIDSYLVGLAAIMEQPNPVPQLINRGEIKRRVTKIIDDILCVDCSHDKRRGSVLRHYCHIGLTNDLEQVKNALRAVNSGHVKADKTFYTHSTGNMGILDEDIQRKIWKLKGEMGYNAVSIGHFEDEKAFSDETPYDPRFPLTHSIHQTMESELIQVERQVANAWDANFKGIFYIAHVSNPDTIAYVKELRASGSLPFTIVIEMTWHHMLLNWSSYYHLGNIVKMNPPLRSESVQARLLDHALKGDVDIIGTDHAPHPASRKMLFRTREDGLNLMVGNNVTNIPKEHEDSVLSLMENPYVAISPPASGIPAILFWPFGIKMLRDYGICNRLLNKMIFHNAKTIFKLDDVKSFPVSVDLEHLEDHWFKYGFNPFAFVNK